RAEGRGGALEARRGRLRDAHLARDEDVREEADEPRALELRALVRADAVGDEAEREPPLERLEGGGRGRVRLDEGREALDVVGEDLLAREPERREPPREPRAELVALAVAAVVFGRDLAEVALARRLGERRRGAPG